ncbi:MAG: hypothetical protein UT19_C0005G0047 [Candidatus Woesebacteria bacterium GW2011_GWB1_39_10b]|uniref:Uncharacterized protein n=3 Tax=Candidatus Woeseibacteriota TaxID=1752722 RepID=A0A0G0NE95_9BACT|nr:MAG: hypothetical protein US72_C0012G0088 [Microgenomates group bacterium GW2011_GWC1_38_12]KKQ94032.1 MAG: hypothetical protein UT19_C0005G0047 [Candidatus Woesebacteria bacterium GW2011_GWB1_39_10b]KKR13823.1 MAG: hypothetical protein UT40_C0010G0051 [Candidatus Woesebacteria bacterium GW2011_GWA1_39_21b]OGM65190.1 MAG: hypothetical protein A3A52_04840 [Candidatus Woesebacteria bacterium RIFCSPLOWO2_01_FULL_39_14]
MTIIYSMNKKQKEEQIKFFVDAFHEVVIPVLDNLATKDDLNQAVDKIERRIDKIDDRLDRHGKMLGDHEKKLDKISKHIRLVAV